MYREGTIRINLDQLLIALFYLYAFSMPFELILEILLGIDTIFKPFRLVTLAIIGVFGIRVLKNGLSFNSADRADIFLYLVFAYGILISSFRILERVFNFGLFFNDLFQTGLYVATFFIFKALPLSREQGLRLFRFFLLGILINSIYAFFNFFYYAQFGREAGFTDNPNYAALGLVAAITFILLRTNYELKLSRQLGLGLLALFFTYIFVITGSRTGLVMFLVTLFFIFLFSSWRRKLGIMLVSGAILLLLLPQQLERASLGGPLILLRRVSRSISSEVEDVRFVVWRGVFRTLENVGYAGMGIGQFKAQFPRHYSEESNKLVLEIVNRGYHLSTHNDYLAILTDYGLPSLLLYLIFLFYSMRKATRRMLQPTVDEQQRFLNQLSFILLSCLIIFGIAAENFQHQLFWFLLMFSTKSFYQPSPT